MKKEVFINNRKKIFNMMKDNSLLISFSIVNDDEYFKVNSNYYYLTGNEEKDNILCLLKKDNKEEEYIFIKPYDPIMEKWIGRALSSEEIKDITGIKNILYLEDKKTFNKLIESVDNVYLDLSHPEYRLDKTYEEELKETLKCNVLDYTPLLQTARTIKSSEEIEEFKHAIAITNEGIKDILRYLKPGMMEYQIESYFDRAIKFNGANGYSFPTIAASGKNGPCLHYSQNKDMMNDGDLVLFDLGATYNYYCADISRTFPINGKFSARQKQLYNIVLEAQQKVFEFLRPGVTTKEANQVVINFYKTKLKEIGLIKNDEEVSKYYYHGVSHHIGLLCHDLCDYTPLKPGCIVSVEPGLYIKEEGIGIRIEDDALITESGCINLSKDIIKTVDDIEDFMNKEHLEN